jgi:hypothetical protein
MTVGEEEKPNYLVSEGRKKVKLSLGLKIKYRTTKTCRGVEE